MRKTVDASAERLEQVTAQLEQAARRNQGGGIMGALKPFLLGALVGAGMALLYAPQRGEQTRAMLRRNATDLQDRAMQTASSVKERLPEQAQTALDQAQGRSKAAVEPGKETLQAVKAEAEQGANEVTAAAKKRAPNGSRAEEAQAQPQRDRKTGSENPA